MIGTAKNKYGKIEKNKKIKEGKCVFPFKYQWKTHDDCVNTEKGAICATSVNDKQTLQTYGYCEDKKLIKTIDNLEQTLNSIQATPNIASIGEPNKTKSPKSKPSPKQTISTKPVPEQSSFYNKPKTPSPLVTKEKSKSKSKSPKSKSPTLSANSKKTSPISINLSTKKKTLSKQSEKSFKKNKTIKLKPTMTKSKSSTPTNIIGLKSSTKQTKSKKRYNEEFIDLLGELHQLLMKKGEFMRARAYQKAQESIINYDQDITSTDQIKDLKGVGATIVKKMDEYIETGKINALEKERNNPIHIFTEIYGIGPKKAKELIEKDKITTIDELKAKKDQVLNSTQLLGLQYYEDILKRIPRDEIVDYEKILSKAFDSVKDDSSSFDIVGSYRRGAKTSGDIDVIITSKEDNKSIFENFIQKLVDEKVIIHKLTDGKTKTLVIAKLENKPARRVDFLYSPPSEYHFARLYFTGSKIFNTVMRQRALNMGYSLNEHGFYKMEDKKKGAKIDKAFNSEEEIFDFLNMKYKTPEQRIDGRSVQTKSPIVFDADSKTKQTKSIKEFLDEPKEESKNISVKSIAEPKEKIQLEKPKPEKTTKKNKTIKLKKAKVSPQEHILHFKEHGIDHLKNLGQKDLENMIIYAKDQYFNDPDNVSMTDNEYDIVKEYLERKHPKSKIINEVGAPIDKVGKVNLPYEMWSMDKIKPTTDALVKWTQKYNEPSDYVISAKLDGVSGMYSTENNQQKLYTRGNGIIGQDVSHLIPYLNLPKEENIVIRGEFLISKDNFEKYYKEKSANPRNLVAGIVNKQKVTKNEFDHLDFVGYEVIKPEVKPSYQLQYLLDLNVNTVKFESSKVLSNEFLSSKLVSWRENYKYEIDGIIVTHDKLYSRKSGNPLHAFAFKMVLSDQVAEAKVVDVLWTPSKDGYLKPKIRIEPIQLGGVKIEYATAFNAAFVENNKLGIGAIVELVRSGDVIPHIMKVTSPAEKLKMPNEKYVWNETHIDIMLENKENNKIVILKNISGFFKDIGVDGLSVGNTKKIIDGGFDTIEKILAMTKDDFLKLDGFKETLANKLHNGIKEKIENTSLVKLMSATNIFGRGLGEKKIKPIMEELPDILVSNESPIIKIEKVSKVKSVANKTAQLFVEKIPLFLEFLKKANLEHKLKVTPKPVSEKDKSHPLFEKKIVITGFRNKELENKIINVGGELSTSVSKNTFIVIAKDIDDETGKVMQAKEKSIPIVTMEQFEEKYFPNEIHIQ